MKEKTKVTLLGLIQLNQKYNIHNLETATRLSELYLEVQKERTDSPLLFRVLIGFGIAGSFLGGVTIAYIVGHLIN